MENVLFVEKDAKPVRMKIPVTYVHYNPLTTTMELVLARKVLSLLKLIIQYTADLVLIIVLIVMKLLINVDNVLMAMYLMMMMSVFVQMVLMRIPASSNVFPVCLDARLVIQVQLVQIVTI